LLCIHCRLSISIFPKLRPYPFFFAWDSEDNLCGKNAWLVRTSFVRSVSRACRAELPSHHVSH